MNTISEILNFPDKTVVPELRVTVTEVYPAEDWQGKRRQGIKLVDSSGEMKATLWEHDDATPLKGGEFILKSTQGRTGFGGVKVDQRDTKYAKKLSISKAGVFQPIEVHRDGRTTQTPNPTGASAQGSGGAALSKPPQILGATVGMAINNACANLTARGETLDPKAIEGIASSIIRLAQKLERGELTPESENPF